MQDDDQASSPEELNKQLFEIVNRMLERHGKKLPLQRGIFANYSQPPFDISKPNQHDSKSEFKLEYDAVSNGLNGIEQVLQTLYRKPEDQPSIDLLSRLIPDIDSKFRSIFQPEDLKNSYHLIRSNAASVGGFIACLYLFRDLRAALKERLRELEDQKDLFWSIKHRPPDYYARFIALRLAKLYAREAGTRPTTGSSSEDGEPSTSYTRALKDVFELLGISVGVRLPAEWALNELTEDDINPPNPFMSNMTEPASESPDDFSSLGALSGLFRNYPNA
ncbi:hypothetical protein [Roseibium sp.]|uniref:hypothetical protein n=1 Tax=Roseibium sp. TaxID=1936156 RepID=UPI003B5234CE